MRAIQFPFIILLAFVTLIFNSCRIPIEETTSATFDSTFVMPDSGYAMSVPDTNIQPKSPYEVGMQYTPMEIYFALYRKELALNGDTIPLRKIREQLGEETTAQRMKRSDELMSTSSDILLEVLAQKAPKVIYGRDNREDVLLTNNEGYVADARKVAVLIEKIHLQPENDSSFKLIPKGTFGAEYRLCEEPQRERFHEQAVVAFCSGVAINSKKILTAGHCIDNSSVRNFYVVFDYMLSSGRELPLSISRENVFEVTHITSLPPDTYNNDFRVLTLNKQIPPFRIAAYRTDGIIPNNNLLHVIGAPCGLPMKVTDSAEIIYNDQTAFFKINSDTYRGNSGSPVFNSQTHLLEGLLVRGAEDFKFITTSGNCRTSVNCRQYGECFGEDVIRSKQFLSAIK